MMDPATLASSTNLSHTDLTKRVDLSARPHPGSSSAGLRVPNHDVARERPSVRSRLMLIAESGLWLAGVASLSVFVTVQMQQRAAAQEALQAFYAQQPIASFVDSVEAVIDAADKSDWSPARIEVYETSAPGAAMAALGVLRIPSLSLEAPVFEGALDHELDRGPGWIRGTAPIGSPGNLAIAGHRDGFFRALKDIGEGDVIEVLGHDSHTRYTVTDTWIVAPDAVHVLAPTGENSLTLVTCHPFYFVGHAPDRFIVRAVANAI